LSAPDAHPLEPGLAILRERSARQCPVGAELERLERTGRLTTPRTLIAVSHVHMHLNRLLRSSNSAQELVIADFLARLYEADLHRRAT
jgi:thiopeptide-type bacteriocin biosynthesis protein